MADNDSDEYDEGVIPYNPYADDATVKMLLDAWASQQAPGHHQPNPPAVASMSVSSSAPLALASAQCQSVCVASLSASESSSCGTGTQPACSSVTMSSSSASADSDSDSHSVATTHSDSVTIQSATKKTDSITTSDPANANVAVSQRVLVHIRGRHRVHMAQATVYRLSEEQAETNRFIESSFRAFLNEHNISSEHLEDYGREQTQADGYLLREYNNYESREGIYEKYEVITMQVLPPGPASPHLSCHHEKKKK